VIVELADWDLPQVFGNVARRRLTFVGKQVLPAHEHNFAHAHIVMRGTIRCTLKKDETVLSVTDYPAGSMFEVPAKVGHQLESISDEGAEGWCIFAVRDEDGGVAYEVTDAHRKDRFWRKAGQWRLGSTGRACPRSSSGEPGTANRSSCPADRSASSMRSTRCIGTTPAHGKK
jgi:quercetin dioxygenase-like cupin family protein